MHTSTLTTLRNVALLALPIAVALVVFANACGAFHGAPVCGPLSMAAIPLVVLPLFLEHVLFSEPQSETTRRIMLWLVAYLLSLVLVLIVHRLRALSRRT
jgi:hypothetical protein